MTIRTRPTRRPLAGVRGPLRDIGLNAVAFGMVIAIQQLLVFPGLGRMNSAADFSEIILLITISTIVVNVLGTEASKVSLIRSEAYRRRGLPWDSPRLVLCSLLLVTLLVLLVTVSSTVSWLLAAQYGAITLLGIIRSFGTTPDKYLGAFHRVVLAHSAYAIGAVIGLFLVHPTGSPYMPFLVAESLAVAVVAVIRVKHREVALTLRRTEEFRPTLRPFLTLALIALLINCVTYIDRLTITPIIGAGALATYYSASALSNSLSLITNPTGNALLARLGRMTDERREQMFARGRLLAFPLVLVFWAGSLVISYLGLVILYPFHLDAAVELLIPVSLAAAFTNTVSLLSPLLQRFLPIVRLLKFYVAYAVVYLAGIIAFSMFWGLSGFAWASALANAALFGMYLVQIRGAARWSDPRPPDPVSDRTTSSTPHTT